MIMSAVQCIDNVAHATVFILTMHRPRVLIYRHGNGNVNDKSNGGSVTKLRREFIVREHDRALVSRNF